MPELESVVYPPVGRIQARDWVRRGGDGPNNFRRIVRIEESSSKASRATLYVVMMRRDRFGSLYAPDDALEVGLEVENVVWRRSTYPG